MGKFGIETEVTTHMKGMTFGELSGGTPLVDDVKGRLEDTSFLAEWSSALCSSWGNPDVSPFGVGDCASLLVDTDSVYNSSVGMGITMAGGQVHATFPVTDPEHVGESAKYALAIGINGYIGTSAVNGYPLILKIDGFDESTGSLTVSAVNGRPIGDAMLLPSMTAGTTLLLLTGIPEFPGQEYILSGGTRSRVVLASDCPALSTDAKRGDVYCRADDVSNEPGTWNPSRFFGMFIKLYSFEEKLQHIIANPGRMCPSVADAGQRVGVFCADKLDFSSLSDIDFPDEKGYVLLLKDCTAGSGSSAKSYRKGDFLLVDFNNSEVIANVPFDIFFK